MSGLSLAPAQCDAKAAGERGQGWARGSCVFIIFVGKILKDRRIGLALTRTFKIVVGGVCCVCMQVPLQKLVKPPLQKLLQSSRFDYDSTSRSSQRRLSTTSSQTADDVASALTAPASFS